MKVSITHSEDIRPKPWKKLALVGKKSPHDPVTSQLDYPGNAALLVHSGNDAFWTTKRTRGFTQQKHEPEIWHILNRFLTKNTLFIDGGANIGAWSSVVGQAIQNPKQVIAIEPNESIVSQLQQNCALNGNNFTIIEKALWSGSGDVVAFHQYADHVASSVEERPDQRLLEKRHIHTVTIDDIVQQAMMDVPTIEDVIVKLDIEGAEHTAFLGAVNTLSSRNTLIIYEDPRIRDPDSKTTAAILSQGLQVYYMDRNGGIRAIEDVEQLKSIKLPPREGYNFIACKAGSGFDMALKQEIQKQAAMR